MTTTIHRSYSDIVMKRRLHSQALIAVLLIGQLTASLAGGALLVQCRGINGHSAIEIAHTDPCDAGDGSMMSNGTSAVAASSSESERCADEPIGIPDLARENDRPTAPPAPTLILLWTLNRPQSPRPIAAGVAHVPSPDSAQALAQSVILLI